MVRMSDLKVNATNIVTLSGRRTDALRHLKKGWAPGAYEVVMRGPKCPVQKHQGTYVNLEIGIGLCRRYGLPELEKRLKELKRTPEGTVLEAEPGHLGSSSRASRLLPEPPASNTVSARNESTQPRGSWNLDQQPKSSVEPIPDGSIQAEQARETNSGLDEANSSGSVLSREPRSTE
ncbi:MAG: hypothetical protein Q9207_001636 [Kuettlingeria erythrocarpa]